MDNILLATDLGPNSDRAMERALKLAAESETTLHILHVTNTADRETSEIEETIKAYMKNNKDADKANIEISVLTNQKPYDEISAYAADIKTGLIIMGTHAEPKLSDLFFGTTIEKVLIHSPAPILMVKNKPIGPYQTVLSGVDYAPASQRAIECAISIAPTAAFHLLNAAEDAPVYPSPQMLSVMGITSISEEDREKHMNTLIKSLQKNYEAQYEGHALTIRSSLEKADPYYALIKETDKNKYDLLCIGTYGEPSEKVGAVTDSLMSDPPCDILIASAQ
ncbi:MAG: universal stress protein [Alcanivorax sp.]